ncbi:MAG TPA: Asp-tRNA(Asn)/Glu-tRNA(Gln) amidotransferase subunit GatA [Blastocatellia bacterium]|nr:Asp-tRNA(Asn)/Glu-tRNA(Gln) amidotransferase subunit GatA [Blastocatellia bacterium]
MELRKLSFKKLNEMISSHEATAVEVCRAALERAEKLSDLNAFITLIPEAALERAARIDRMAEKGDPLPPLAGAVIAVKDNMVITGVRTTAGSRILHNYRPPYTATVVERLQAAGAVVIGKTNCDEFAMGSSNENSAYGPVKNPWDTSRVPGGSSGGSAAAVSAGIVMCALGSDTGGSIRQPASFCGVVGLKPTYGRVSRYGLIAFGSSLDQIGPFTNSVEDAALALRVMAGRDLRDSTSSDAPVDDYAEAIRREVRGLRVGVPREYYGEGLDGEVRAQVEAAIGKLEGLGAEIVEVSLPHTEYAVPVYYLIATAEASSNLARYDGVRYGFRAEEAATLREMYSRTRDEGFGDEVKRRIMLGTYALSAGYYDAYYGKAQKVRSLMERDFSEAFERCDVIATPTAPTPPFRLGEKTADPLEMYLSDIYTITANLAGVPGMSLPCGFSSEGLPIGIQLIGRRFDEASLLRAAHNLELALGLDFTPSGQGREQGSGVGGQGSGPVQQ